MPRAVSPTPSDGEVDIFDSINANDIPIRRQAAPNEGFDFLNDVDEDGDEAFIALKQAASYRKTTNIKGKTGKKQGGFQSMGMCYLFANCSLTARTD